MSFKLNNLKRYWRISVILLLTSEFSEIYPDRSDKLKSDVVCLNLQFKIYCKVLALSCSLHSI